MLDEQPSDPSANPVMVPPLTTTSVGTKSNPSVAETTGSNPSGAAVANPGGVLPQVPFPQELMLPTLVKHGSDSDGTQCCQPVLDPDHTLTFFMHDILGGSNPSALAVTGAVSNPALNGQLPFAKPNGANLPVNNGINQNSGNNGLLNNNNVPLLSGLGGNTQAMLQNAGNNNNNGGFPALVGGQVPAGSALQKLMFGTMTVIDDELTAGHELGSEFLGKAQGFYVASSVDGTSQTMAFTAMFQTDTTLTRLASSGFIGPAYRSRICLSWGALENMSTLERTHESNGFDSKGIIIPWGPWFEHQEYHESVMLQARTSIHNNFRDIRRLRSGLNNAANKAAPVLAGMGTSGVKVVSMFVDNLPPKPHWKGLWQNGLWDGSRKNGREIEWVKKINNYIISVSFAKHVSRASTGKKPVPEVARIEEDVWSLRWRLVGTMRSVCSASSIEDRLHKWGLGEIKVQRIADKTFISTIDDEDLYLFLEDLQWSYLKEIFSENWVERVDELYNVGLLLGLKLVSAAAAWPVWLVGIFIVARLTLFVCKIVIVTKFRSVSTVAYPFACSYFPVPPTTAICDSGDTVRCTEETNGVLDFAVTMFTSMQNDCQGNGQRWFAPVRPVRKGTLLGLIRLLKLLMLLTFTPVRSGAAPCTGKRSLLVLENGMPLISEFAITPVTTLADGCDPPRMSCMKKDSVGSCVPGFPVVALVAAAVAAPGPAIGSAGVATGASLSSGAATAAGTSGSGGQRRHPDRLGWRQGPLDQPAELCRRQLAVVL
ncbi:Dirigent protein 10 [Hibiscus syriacus]|uniref:Dirigent protein 10 n=1 Tax=Hibiscus syriacus TaxID=106335 RepID=A0A6A2YVC9_HIBSY|nr:Dirigent protein 10 [Hibiscus syriacus]